MKKGSMAGGLKPFFSCASPPTPSANRTPMWGQTRHNYFPIRARTSALMYALCLHACLMQLSGIRGRCETSWQVVVRRSIGIVYSAYVHAESYQNSTTWIMTGMIGMIVWSGPQWYAYAKRRSMRRGIRVLLFRFRLRPRKNVLVACNAPPLYPSGMLFVHRTWQLCVRSTIVFLMPRRCQ